MNDVATIPEGIDVGSVFLPVNSTLGESVTDEESHRGARLAMTRGDQRLPHFFVVFLDFTNTSQDRYAGG